MAKANTRAKTPRDQDAKEENTYLNVETRRPQRNERILCGLCICALRFIFQSFNRNPTRFAIAVKIRITAAQPADRAIALERFGPARRSYQLPRCARRR